MDEGQTDSLLAGFADYERLTIPGKGGMPMPAAAVREDFAGKSWAGVKAKIVATDSVLGATTHFKPKFREQNPTVAEYGFWALWDWMILYLLRTEELDVLARSFNSFTYQLSLYQAHGNPRLYGDGSDPVYCSHLRNERGLVDRPRLPDRTCAVRASRFRNRRGRHSSRLSRLVFAPVREDADPV